MLTTQVESFADCANELAQIFPQHWEELALFKDRMPLSPQWSEYVRREREGLLFLATVRWNAKIVGYYTAQVAPGFHYSRTLTGTHDLVYVIPEARERGLALPLFRCVERELKRRGVKLWYSGYKTSNDLGMPLLLDRLGFVPADSYSAKWIG
jgi:GNAT superfamily N-acetyltransferase